jgi:hypothetical protein
MQPSRIRQFKFNAKVRIQRALKETAVNLFGHSLNSARIAAQENDLRGFFGRLRPIDSGHGLMRIGNGNDGGYLVADDLGGIRTCFSPGVSTMVDFELALVERNIRCYLADYSIESCPVRNDLIQFEKRFLGAHDDSVYMTLASWLHRHADPQDRDMILQMDIEGDEYDVLMETPMDILCRFRVIVIEFHFLEGLFNPAGFKLINNVFMKLSKAFNIVHLHPNNFADPVRYGEFVVPPVMEITFHRIDRVSSAIRTRTFPHELDAPCCPWRDDYPVPSCWYS